MKGVEKLCCVQILNRNFAIMQVLMIQNIAKNVVIMMIVVAVTAIVVYIADIVRMKVDPFFSLSVFCDGGSRPVIRGLSGGPPESSEILRQGQEPCCSGEWHAVCGRGTAGLPVGATATERQPTGTRQHTSGTPPRKPKTH